MELLQFTLPTGAKLTAWLHSKEAGLVNELCYNRPAIVVCPGGGYGHVSDREKDPVAAEFYAMGAQVFTLKYSLGEQAGNKRPLEEVARSVLMVRQNAEQWSLDPNRILVIGFSAGGHLAASLGVHWDDPEIMTRCGVDDAQLLRPDGMILCYPVITADPDVWHSGSIKTVSAGTNEAPEYWSLETQVKETTPPAFIWHTMEDKVVPVANSFLFASALHRCGVTCEAHFFPHGGHGMSVCTTEVNTPHPIARQWMPLCRNWLDTHFGPLCGA